LLSNKNIILFLPIILLIFSCSSESNPTIYQNQNSSIFPLAVGNKWKYLKIHYNGNDKPLDSSVVVSEITSRVELNKENWFGFDNSILATSRNDGIWFKETQPPYETEAKLIYKFPTYLGDSYSHYEVVSVNKIIKIGNRYYSTIVYRRHFEKDGQIDNDAIYDEDYLCRGIGLVKSIAVRVNEFGKLYVFRNMILLNYNIN